MGHRPGPHPDAPARCLRGATPERVHHPTGSVPVDGHVLDQQIGAYMWTRTMTLGQRRVIALDGKTIRGARRGGQPAPHLVFAFDHATGTVLGQVAVALKSNEIPAVRALLATFDLTDAVVTVDALCRPRHKASTVTTAPVRSKHASRVRTAGIWLLLAATATCPRTVPEVWSNAATRCGAVVPPAPAVVRVRAPRTEGMPEPAVLRVHVDDLLPVDQCWWYSSQYGPSRRLPGTLRNWPTARRRRTGSAPCDTMGG